MRTRVLLAVSVLLSCAVWPADKLQPLNVKLGLWEVTQTTFMPGLPQIPPEALAKMPAEQRARFEESMKQNMSGSPGTMTTKSCETKEKLEKQMLFNDKNMECTRTMVSSSSRKMEMKIHCDHEGMKSDGTLRIDAVNSENVKGTIQMTSTGGGRAMNVNSNFTAKWLGPDCGAVK